MLESFTCATFSSRLGERFAVQVDGATSLDVEVVEARELGEAREEAARPPFSVIFQGPRQPVLPQRIYRFQHPDMGAFDLFIVPVGADQRGIQYEAVFT